MELTLDAVAALPGRGPWAVRVLAAALCEGCAPLEVAWPEAPAAARWLAEGVARGGARWSMWSADHAQWGLALAPTRRCPCLRADGKEMFTLLIGEHGLGYALWWEEGGERASVEWFDEEDGSTSPRGSLEGWCEGLLGAWLVRYEGEEPRHDLPLLRANDEAALRGFLARLSARREALRGALAEEVARREAEIEALEGARGDATRAYEAWLEAGEALARLRGTPWGHLLAPESEEEGSEDRS